MAATPRIDWALTKLLEEELNHRQFASGLRQDDRQFQRQRILRRRAVQRRVDGAAARAEFDLAAVAGGQFCRWPYRRVCLFFPFRST